MIEKAEDAIDAAKEIGGNIWVVKAQIHAGGRGKRWWSKTRQIPR